ncbi:hypothetical protein BRARA_I01382 [Brassica rapa]|uniref:TIR domain-containing protein n=1 Tax=Brassica campestris TaxID=3711 RepID=A0A397XVK3_BRACM|nr:hypothetical protein BRARA_I01382 [Brassica rapa]
MASSSSSSSRPRTWRYRVFTSFHGPDVRKTFLSHLRKEFNNNGISMFDDQGIERGQTIAPELRRAIRESRISIVVLSEYYASSSWCLDELVEILKCKKDKNQIVMTIFYGGVDPSDVRKQTGDFGKVFKKTCARKTEEERRKWSQALNRAGKIAGEHFLNWHNESEMIEKIARDVSNKLSATTVSNDFEDMVGIEAHLRKVQILLHLDDEDGAMFVGICGPAGIGKTTIARALHSRLSSTFQLSCFMENLRGSCNSGLDEYGLKLRLQELLLSKTLNKNDMRICNLGAIPKRLYDQKVLIILDDVDDLQQLEALANDTNWFGHGSRIIVTTEDQEILEQHGIHKTYHVDFPTKIEAREIFCRYAFTRWSSAPDGFEKLAERATELCSNLPLGLCIIGSMLRGKKEDDWESILHRLENSSIPKIDALLRVRYDSLHENEQFLLLLIAFFFNYYDYGHVKEMLADNNLDVRLGLKTLAYKSLIQISAERTIVMHKLLHQVCRQAIQSQEPWKRQILVDTDKILHVFKKDSGNKSVMGISFDISTIKDSMDISPKALKRMRNLQFLRIYNTIRDTNVRVHVPENMDFPPRLKLLHWEEYPGTCLPHTLRPEHLVELNLEDSKLKHLWEGTQPLGNLKKLNLSWSSNLEELPDLGNATNLEILDVCKCQSLVEIHSSVGNLHKLERLEMGYCGKLQVIPSLFNLTSLETVGIAVCDQLRKLPDISATITELSIVDTMLEEFTASVRRWSRLQTLLIGGSVIPNQFMVERSGADIERIPDCIKDLHRLENLYIVGCPKLVSLPELPTSLKRLIVWNCESLAEILVSFPSDSKIEDLCFPDCVKLGPEARRVITQLQSSRVCLPGKTIPAEFNHRADGNSLAICSNAFGGFKMCVIVSPKTEMEYANDIIEFICRILINGCPMENCIFPFVFTIQSEHLFIFHSEIRRGDRRLDQYSDILFEFSASSQDIKIVECGVQI